jgi:hypothetical protein
MPKWKPGAEKLPVAAYTPRLQTVCLLAALATWFASGCGPRTDRLPVSGNVTLDGVPLEDGVIRLTSVGTERILASGAMIQNGEFDIPADKGLRPGTYHVEINAPDESAPPMITRQTPGGPGIPTQPDRIPPEFNVDSQNTIEVAADGENHFEFEIVTRSAD